MREIDDAMLSVEEVEGICQWRKRYIAKKLDD